MVGDEAEGRALDVVPKFANGVDHAEGLELVDGVFLLGRVELLRAEGDRAFAAVAVELGQYPSHRKNRRIRHDDERLRVVGVNQDGVASQRGLEVGHGGAVLVRPLPHGVLLAQLIQRISHRGVIRHVLGVEIRHAQKRRQLVHVRRVLEGGDGDGLFGIGAAASGVDGVAQARELGEADEGFRGLQAQIALAAALEDLARAVDMDDPAVRPNDNVVEVQEANDPLQPGEGGVHHALEDARGVLEAEGHHAELVQAAVTNKRRAQFCALRVFNLPEALGAVESRDKFEAVKQHEGVVDAGQGVHVALRDTV